MNHIGRAWTGHEIEDKCPCLKAACGLVVQETAAQECAEHAGWAAKSIRQGHSSDQCPGNGTVK